MLRRSKPGVSYKTVFFVLFAFLRLVGSDPHSGTDTFFAPSLRMSGESAWRKRLSIPWLPQIEVAAIRSPFEPYSPIADRWKFFDKTFKPRLLIASEEKIVNAEVWDKLKQEYRHV